MDCRRPVLVAPAFMDALSMFRKRFSLCLSMGVITMHSSLHQRVHVKVTFGHNNEHAAYVLKLVPRDSRADARKLAKDPSARLSHLDRGTALVIYFSIANLAAPHIFMRKPPCMLWVSKQSADV